jgi:hypothetical protein
MQRGTRHSDSTLAKMKATAARIWTPAKRKRQSRIMKRVAAVLWTEERHQRHSAAMRAYHARKREHM